MKIPLEKKEAKILFVNPCLRKGAESKLPPVGLTYVMTMFKENGYDFSLLDIDINEFDDSYVEDYVKNNKYDFVLLGSIVTHYKWIKWFVNTVKDFHPTTNVIVGNSVAGSIPETFFEKTLADVIVIGEGEYSALDAVDAIRLGKNLEEVEGIACRDKNGKALITPPKEVGNINEIPMIDWELVEIQRYLKTAGGFLDKNEKAENTRILPVATARGCAFKCTFCHYVFWNDPYRNRSPESIIEEIKRDIEKYNVNYINFWDDLSFASSVHVERLCDAIIESGLKFKWSASIRVDVFTRARLTRDESLKVAKKMKQSGCYSCGFSLESGNQEILEMMNKKIEVDAFMETVQILQEANIICNTSVVFGYPIETKKSINETFEQCLKAGVYPSIGFLLPLPATGMWDYAVQNGFIKDTDSFLESITERQDICLNMTKLTNDEIMSEIKKGGKELNEMLELGLDENSYIRTGRYKNYKAKVKTKIKNFSKSKQKDEFPLDPENVERNENDFSFNYSATEFKAS
jgi:anaerobic magnesium-protoporphyrin IX monomethyl ester cyclase